MCHSGPSQIGKQRPSLSQLAAWCRIAAINMPVGSCWRHYKGDIYEITGYTVSEADNQIKVVYRPVPKPPREIDGIELRYLGDDTHMLDGLQFDRPVDEFQALVETEAGSDAADHAVPPSVPRFERVRRADCYVPYSVN